MCVQCVMSVVCSSKDLIRHFDNAHLLGSARGGGEIALPDIGCGTREHGVLRDKHQSSAAIFWWGMPFSSKRIIPSFNKASNRSRVNRQHFPGGGSRELPSGRLIGYTHLGEKVSLSERSGFVFKVIVKELLRFYLSMTYISFKAFERDATYLFWWPHPGNGRQ